MMSNKFANCFWRANAEHNTTKAQTVEEQEAKLSLG